MINYALKYALKYALALSILVLLIVAFRTLFSSQTIEPGLASRVPVIVVGVFASFYLGAFIHGLWKYHHEHEFWEKK